MGFEWDEKKAKENLEKHGVAFADAAPVLNDDMGITIPDPGSDDEERFVTIGSDPLGRVLVVVFTWRGDNARLISARKATRRERSNYEDKRT